MTPFMLPKLIRGVKSFAAILTMMIEFFAMDYVYVFCQISLGLERFATSRTRMCGLTVNCLHVSVKARLTPKEFSALCAWNFHFTMLGFHVGLQ